MATTTYGSPYVSGSDLVAGWPAASLTVADAIDAAGYYVGRGINAQTASYTGVLTDAGKTVTMSNAGATTFTVPANSSVAYPTGTRINILNLGAGACTPTAGAGVTISGTISALATNQGAAVVKTATNTWSYLPFTSGTPVLTSSDVSSTTGSPTITTSGGNTIYKFTGSGSITLGKAGLATVLVIGGGGGGGNLTNRSFGGAGGMYPFTNLFLPTGSNTITVGGGGPGGSTNASGPFFHGSASKIGTLVIIDGGGGGASTPTINFPGDSGGSGSGATLSGYGAGVGVNGLGNAGSDTTTGAGGGAGGAASGSTAGIGLANSITGSSVTYATGGAAGTSVTVNTGNGHGNGTAGDSGIVIISVTT